MKRQIQLLRLVSILLIAFLAGLIRFPPSIYSMSFVLVSALVVIQFLVVTLYTPSVLHWSRLKSRRFFIPASLLVVCAGFSVIRAPYRQVALDSFALYLFAYLFYLVAPLVFGERRWLGAAGVFVFFFALLGATGYVEWKQGPERLLELYAEQSASIPSRMYEGLVHSVSQGRALAVYGNPNHLASVLAILLPMLWIVIGKAKGRTTQAAIAILALPPLVAIYATYSRAGYLLTVLVLAASGWVAFRASRQPDGGGVSEKRIPKKWILAGVSVTAGLLLVAGLALRFGPSDFFGGRLLTLSTLKARGEFYLAAWKMIRMHPFLGNGLGSYEILYPQFRLLGGVEAKYPHNLFIQAWVEGGLPLLFSWGFVVFVFGVAFIRQMARPAGEDRNLWRSALALGSFLFLLHAQIDFVNTMAFPLLFFFLALSQLEKANVGDLSEVYEQSPQARIRYLAFVVLLVFLPFWYTFIHLASLSDNEFRTGLALVRSGQPFEALPYYRQAVEHNPRNSTSREHLALTYLQLNMLDLAVEHAEKAVELDPRTSHLHQSLGMILERRADLAALQSGAGSFGVAERQYKIASNLHPNKPDYHRDLARIYRKMGEMDKAKKEARLAEEVDKGYSGSWRVEK